MVGIPQEEEEEEKEEEEEEEEDAEKEDHDKWRVGKRHLWYGRKSNNDKSRSRRGRARMTMGKNRERVGMKNSCTYSKLTKATCNAMNVISPPYSSPSMPSHISKHVQFKSHPPNTLRPPVVAPSPATTPGLGRTRRQ